MKLTVYNAIDARQSPQWGKYLSSIGWKIERVGATQLFIHTVPLLNYTVIKIQHPTGPLPLKELDKIAKKYKALFVIIEPHSYGYDEKSLKRNSYQKSFLQFAHTATIKIDLDRTEKDLLNSFSENAKRNIRKAQKNNLILKTVWFKDDKENAHFTHFYKLLVLLAKTKKFYAPSYDEYHKKMSAFKNTSVLLFAYENESQDPIAVVWLASYGKIITYMQTGITKKGYDLLANYFLVWEGFKLAQQMGMKIFDFETMYDPRFPKENKDWQGYTEFKKRFHGTIIEYPQPWIKFYNSIARFFYSIIFLFH